MTDQSISQLLQAANDNDGFALTLLGVVIINSGENADEGLKHIFFAADAKNVLWAKCLKRYILAFSPCQLPIHCHALLDADAREQLECYAYQESNMWAMTILGDLYWQGKVTVRNREKATMLLNNAAEMKVY